MAAPPGAAASPRTTFVAGMLVGILVWWLVLPIRDCIYRQHHPAADGALVIGLICLLSLYIVFPHMTGMVETSQPGVILCVGCVFLLSNALAAWMFTPPDTADRIFHGIAFLVLLVVWGLQVMQSDKLSLTLCNGSTWGSKQWGQLAVCACFLYLLANPPTAVHFSSAYRLHPYRRALMWLQIVAFIAVLVPIALNLEVTGWAAVAYACALLYALGVQIDAFVRKNNTDNESHTSANSVAIETLAALAFLLLLLLAGSKLWLVRKEGSKPDWLQALLQRVAICTTRTTT